MGPAEIKFIRETFGLSQRELAKALSVAPFTVTRWESEDGNRPTGLQLDVLRALYNTALKTSQKKNDTATGVAIGAMVALGIGALVYSVLTQEGEELQPKSDERRNRRS